MLISQKISTLLRKPTFFGSCRSNHFSSIFNRKWISYYTFRILNKYPLSIWLYSHSDSVVFGVFRINSHSWGLYWYFLRWLCLKEIGVETKRRSSIRVNFQPAVPVLLRASFLLGLRQCQNGRHYHSILQWVSDSILLTLGASRRRRLNAILYFFQKWTCRYSVKLVAGFLRENITKKGIVIYFPHRLYV